MLVAAQALTQSSVMKFFCQTLTFKYIHEHALLLTDALSLALTNTAIRNAKTVRVRAMSSSQAPAQFLDTASQAVWQLSEAAR